MFKKFALAAVVALAGLGAGVSVGQSMPVLGTSPAVGGDVIQVRNGCGLHRHVNRWGHCVWNGHGVRPPVILEFHHRHWHGGWRHHARQEHWRHHHHWNHH